MTTELVEENDALRARVKQAETDAGRLRDALAAAYANVNDRTAERDQARADARTLADGFMASDQRYVVQKRTFDAALKRALAYPEVK